MKKIWFVILLSMVLTSKVYSQEVRMNVGLSVSHLKIKNSSISLSKVKSPAIAIGLDYLNSSVWYLSSELVFSQRGIVEKNIPYMPEENEVTYIDYKNKWNIVYLNTLFRVKLPQKKNHFFAGLGPSLNCLLGKKALDEQGGKELNRFNLGLNTQVGYKYRITSKVALTLVYSYMFSITSVGKDNSSQDFKEKDSLFSIGLGYAF